EIGEIHDFGGGVKGADFSDPDGNTFELQEMAWRKARSTRSLLTPRRSRRTRSSANPVAFSTAATAKSNHLRQTPVIVTSRRTTELRALRVSSRPLQDRRIVRATRRRRRRGDVDSWTRGSIFDYRVAIRP